MSTGTFARLLHAIQELSRPPEIFFGGYGEPLSHPHIVDMIRDIKQLGSQAGMVSNGTLLTPSLSLGLIQSGLDKLWISMDNIHQESNLTNQGTDPDQDARANLERFLDLRQDQQLGPEVGLVFVLTTSNSSQLQDFLDQGKELGLRSFFITNLEAFSEELAGETPYKIDHLRHSNSWQATQTQLINHILDLDDSICVEGNLVNPTNRCPFAENGEIALRWDGEVSPCLPLLYDHTSFVGSWKHQVDSFSIGNIHSNSIQGIWNDHNFTVLRERLLDESFSPCLSCRDCWLSDDNRLDCMGYEHPTCGGCLWSQGLISCP